MTTGEVDGLVGLLLLVGVAPSLLLMWQRRGRQRDVSRRLRAYTWPDKREIFRAVRRGVAVNDQRLSSVAADYAAVSAEAWQRGWKARLGEASGLLFFGSALVAAAVRRRWLLVGLDGVIVVGVLAVSLLGGNRSAHARSAEMANRRLAEAPGSGAQGADRVARRQAP